MSVWSNILREKASYQKCISECVMIAANAWLYLMQITLTWIFSPCLRKHQSVFSMYKVLYVFFLFNTFSFFTAW